LKRRPIDARGWTLTRSCSSAASRDRARRALATFDELAQKPDRSQVERNAAIQRSEYRFEAVWKAAQLYLREQEGLDIGSPKAAARGLSRSACSMTRKPAWRW